MVSPKHLKINGSNISVPNSVVWSCCVGQGIDGDVWCSERRVGPVLRDGVLEPVVKGGKSRRRHKKSTVAKGANVSLKSEQ